jgi:hypothetical protein
MSLARKIHYKALHRPLIRISELRREREGERFLRSQPDLWRLLSAYREASESVGCSYADYAYLFRRLREYRYREVLECGTGASTVVLAYAAMLNTRDGSPCRITSLDSIKPWYESACKFFPDELRDCASIHYSDVVPSGFSIYRGVRYASLPERDYDFVFTDGPYGLLEDGSVAANFDFIHLLQNSAPDHAMSTVVDHRLCTCFILQQILPSRFSYYPSRKLGVVADAKKADFRYYSGGSPAEFKHCQRAFGKTTFLPSVDARG